MAAMKASGIRQAKVSRTTAAGGQATKGASQRRTSTPVSYTHLDVYKRQLPNIAVVHDSLGRPLFEYAAPLATLLAQRGLVAHLSISDENDYAVAFVIMEQAGTP